MLLSLCAIVGILCEDSLDLCNDLGRTLDKIGDLLQRIGGNLNAYVNEFYRAVLGYAKNSDGLYRDSGSAACSEVLRLALCSACLIVEINAAGCKSESDLGDRDKSGAGCGRLP